MADKDKKLRVILKLPNKSSSNSKAGISGASASPGVTSHKAHASSVAGSGTSTKLSAQAAGSTANNRVATPPKKRKFKTLVEGDARDNQGGVYGASVTTVAVPAVFKAPLPPLSKKSSHKVMASTFIDISFLTSFGHPSYLKVSLLIHARMYCSCRCC